MTVICFFEKLVDKNNDKVKLDIIPKTNEEYISVTCGCIGFFDIYRFLSSIIDSLDKTVVDNNHKTLTNLKKENVDNDQILNNFNEKGEEDRTFGDLKKILQMKLKNWKRFYLIILGKTILNF